MATKTAIAKKQADQLPAGFDLDEIAEDVDALSPKMSQADLALPFMSVLQSNSPQLDEGDAKYLPDAKNGQWYSLVEHDSFDGRDVGIEIVNAYYERRFVEWRPREDGGGRVQDYPSDHPIQRDIVWSDDGKPFLPNGNLCYETAYVYCLFRDADNQSWRPAIMPLKGTMLKTVKKMNSVIANTLQEVNGKSMQMPRWWHVYTVKTVRQEADGNSWYIPQFDRGAKLTDVENGGEIYQAAKALAVAIKANEYADVIEKEGEADEAGRRTVADNYDPQTGELDEAIDEVPFE